MGTLTDRLTFGGDVWNLLIDRKIHPYRMIYFNGWTIRIQRIPPILKGVVLVTFDKSTGILAIHNVSVFGRWFGYRCLNQVDCEQFANSEESVAQICDLIEKAVHP